MNKETPKKPRIEVINVPFHPGSEPPLTKGYLWEVYFPDGKKLSSGCIAYGAREKARAAAKAAIKKRSEKGSNHGATGRAKESGSR